MALRPTETALKARARALLERMTERARWVYALPPDEAREHLEPTLAALGFAVAPPGPEGARVFSSGDARIAARERPELDVTIVEAEGEAAVEALGALLAKAGFYAQSTLLGYAHDVEAEEAPQALATLAHMAVAWDAAWGDLFALHLAAADAPTRLAALAALRTAARACGEPAAALSLLDALVARESDDAVRDAAAQARAALAAGAA